MAEAQQLGVWGPQQWGEKVEERADELADFIKKPERHIPLTSEDYVAGHLSIDLYVWRWASRGDAHPSHYVAHLRSIRGMNDLAFEVPHSIADLVGEFAINEGAHVHDGDSSLGVDEQGGMDFSVFVAVGEGRQDRQEQDLILPSVVSLASLGYLGGLRADVLEKAMGSEFLGGEVGEDRELNLPRLRIGGFSPEMVYCQLPPKVVKSTAHVVDGVPHHQAPVVSDLRHPLGDPEDKVVLRIKLPSRGEDPGWGFSIARRDDGASEVFYMALCSRQLGPASS